MFRIYLFCYMKNLFLTIYYVANNFFPLYQIILLQIKTLETYCVSYKKILQTKILEHLY